MFLAYLLLLRYLSSWCVYPFHFCGRLTVAKQSTDGYTTYLPKHNFCLYLELGRSGSNAWKTSNLLWDHYGYILAWPKSDVKADKEMAAKQHGSFKKAISILASQYPANPEINAVNQFLGQTDFSDIFACQEWEECKKIKGCNLSFVLEGMNRLVCENNDVKSYITENEDGNDEADETETLQEREGICLVTGERASIARLNPRTPILGTKSNAKIVAFQKNMGFDSYGKEQSFNAPVTTVRNS